VVGQHTWACLKGQGLNKRDFNLYFMRAFTLVLVLAKEMHVDLMLNRMLSYWTADESAHFHYC